MVRCQAATVRSPLTEGNAACITAFQPQDVRIPCTPSNSAIRMLSANSSPSIGPVSSAASPDRNRLLDTGRYDQQIHPTVPPPPLNQLQVQSQHFTLPLYQQ